MKKTLIILVGIPGSGKSTLCKESLPEFKRINQDVFKGDHTKTFEAFKIALDNNLDVVLDRCNINKKQRSPWLNLAYQYNYNVECVYLHVDKETATKRIKNRKDHETINQNASHVEIVDGFLDSFEMPELFEGFNKITLIKNYEQSE